MTSALELVQVSKIYGSGPSEVHALSGVDLAVERASSSPWWGRAAPARARC
jgi:predicted ABC-type transport system involved in lysophospholipase L1 biosynthesis ATPase subunit